MRTLVIMLSIFLSACSDTATLEDTAHFIAKQDTTTILTDTGNKSTYYELRQRYSGVPKYSGAFGTYTAKHTPVAIKHNDKTYYTFSDKVDGVLTIYVTDGEVVTKVHESTIYNDPHSNATISVDSGGHILVYVSAKGSKEAGAIYRSVSPDNVSGFDYVSESWMAYPQPWQTKEGQTILHTTYEVAEGVKERRLYVKSPDCHKLLMLGGHYQVSVYDGSRLHTAYNFHPRTQFKASMNKYYKDSEIPGNVDARTNVYYMYSDNGCDWFNKDGVQLSLPIAADSPLTKILDTDKLVYLKDIGMKGSTPKILYIESTTPDPTEGFYNSRKYYLISPNISPKFISNSGHNYNTGYYYYKGNTEYLVIPTFSPESTRTNYAGGYLVHKKIRTDGRLSSTFPIHRGFYNYARRVHGGDGEGIVSQDITHNSSGKIIKIINQ